MTPQEKALVEIAEFLSGLRVPYMVIGGMANAVWGIARSTVDVDVTVWVNEKGIPAFVKSVSEKMKVLTKKPEEFIRDTRVLPVKTSKGVGVDLILGILPFEKEAIERAISKEVNGGTVRFCTAEDLILHKIVSRREQDIVDIKQLMKVRKDELDHEYLEPRIRELADMMERSEILDIYFGALDK